MSRDTSNDGDDQTYELTAGEVADLQLRTALMGNLGKQYGGDRDLYDTFGWTKDPSIDDYYANYLRNPYARAVVDIPVETTWRDAPEITDAADRETGETTNFKDDVETVVTDQRPWHYCKRADKLAGIGEYGLLVIGFADGKDLIQPVDASSLDGDPTTDLDYLRPFSQRSVEKLRLGGPDSDRWGHPLYYKLDLGDEDDATSQTSTETWVHHSRVVHIAEDRLDDEVRGTPRQEPVLNVLADIEKVLGSAAEVAYRGARDNLHVNVDGDYELEDGGEEMNKELMKYINGLQPFLRTEGADVEDLGEAELDPTPVIDAEIDALSAFTGVPQSMLTGNETGERATTEDRKEWHGQIAERRVQHVGPMIVRPLISRLVQFSVVAEPAGPRFEIDWPQLSEMSEMDESEVMVNRAQVVKYLRSMLAGYGTEEVTEFVETGEFPEPSAASPSPSIDEDDPAVEAYFEQRVSELQQEATG